LRLNHAGARGQRQMLRRRNGPGFPFDHLTFLLVAWAAKFCPSEVELTRPFSPEAVF
jgi:hypothetical protein